MFVISGAGSGIGKGLALCLANRGYDVCIIGRRTDVLAEVAAMSTRIHYLTADVALPEGRAAIVAHLAMLSPIKGLIHNAALIDPICSMADISVSAWETAMRVNVDAPLFLTQALLPHLSQARVLMIGSGVAHFAVKTWAAYCVSKAALLMLTRAWQLEHPAIPFAYVMPGIVDTPMQAIIRNSDRMDAVDVHFFQELKAKDALLTVETVALFLSWLLLDIDASRYAAVDWDIYHEAHHAEWLTSPHRVPLVV